MQRSSRLGTSRVEYHSNHPTILHRILYTLCISTLFSSVVRDEQRTQALIGTIRKWQNDTHMYVDAKQVYSGRLSRKTSYFIILKSLQTHCTRLSPGEFKKGPRKGDFFQKLPTAEARRTCQDVQFAISKKLYLGNNLIGDST